MWKFSPSLRLSVHMSRCDIESKRVHTSPTFQHLVGSSFSSPVGVTAGSGPCDEMVLCVLFVFPSD